MEWLGVPLTHHNVRIGFHKVVKRLHNLFSAFGPFKVCVAFFIGLLQENTEL